MPFLLYGTYKPFSDCCECREEVRGRNFYLDWYNYTDDPSQLTEVTSERGEHEEHTDHSYHIRSVIIFWFWIENININDHR